MRIAVEDNENTIESKTNLVPAFVGLSGEKEK